MRPLLNSTACLLLAALLLAAPRAASAELPAAALRELQRAYDAKQLGRAAAVCRALLRRGFLGRGELVQLLGYRAMIAALRGRHAKAVKSFRRLLALHPTSKLLPSHGRRVRRAFRAAQRWLRRRSPLFISVIAGKDSEQAARVKVMVLADPLKQARTAALYVRRPGAKAYQHRQRRPLRRARWKVDLDKIPGEGRVIEYYVVAYDRRHNAVAGEGSAAAPNRVALGGTTRELDLRPTAAAAGRRRLALAATGEAATPAAIPAWYERWELWAVVGVAVVGAVVGVSVGLSQRAAQADIPIELGLR